MSEAADTQETGNVWLDTVIPVLGGVVALLLFGSPARAVWQARKSGALENLNCLPFLFIVANCVSWVAYSYATANWYLFVPNTLGMLIGLTLFLASFGIGVPDARKRDTLTAVAVGLAAVLPVVGVLERIVLADDPHAGQQAWGYTANVILFLFYLSPLSTLLEVVRHRDSSSLVLPLSAMNVANGALWFTYGLVRGDAFIWLPNGVGAVLGVLQCALCCAFPRRAAAAGVQSASSEQQLFRGDSITRNVSSGSNVVLVAASRPAVAPSDVPGSAKSGEAPAPFSNSMDGITARHTRASLDV